MLRRLGALFILLLVLESRISSPAAAQQSMQARTHYALTVYSDPDRSSHITGILTPKSDVVLEARSVDAVWILGHSLDGTVRGWMERRYLELPSDTNVPGLLISTETMFVPPEAHAVAVYKVISLKDYPVIPNPTNRAREIFERGQILGKDPRVVAKIGDCISDNQHFLSPFGWGNYNLGSYSQLQEVVNTFSDSLTYDSLAAFNGLVTTAVLDPLFANPLACAPGESPLRCEYRVHNSSVAIIMFGAQDLLFTPADDFDRNLRQIIHETIQAGVVPILSTFPGNISMWDKSIQYNQIVVQVALDYEIPLMNLWQALDILPNHGLNDDGRHLSLPLTESGDLVGTNLQKGYPMRNLVTLQALDAIWRSVMY
jgi:hypothetical protein